MKYKVVQLVFVLFQMKRTLRSQDQTVRENGVGFQILGFHAITIKKERK